MSRVGLGNANEKFQISSENIFYLFNVFQSLALRERTDQQTQGNVSRVKKVPSVLRLVLLPAYPATQENKPTVIKLNAVSN